MLHNQLSKLPLRRYGAPDTVSAWESQQVSLLPAAVIVHNGITRLYYRANDTTLSSTGYAIGLATSLDGYAFKKYNNNPVLDVGAAGQWDDDAIARASVLWENNQFVMWYQGRDITPSVVNAIGVATSSDGTNWTKYGSNPVLSPSSPTAWDDDYVLSPAVLRQGGDENNDLIMFFQGYSDSVPGNQIGTATGTDYYTWSKSGSNPTIPLGSGGAWDDYLVGRPTAVYQGGEYKMWYYGRGAAEGQPSSDNRIGYATSSDGVTITKYASNPVLTAGQAWEDADVGLSDPFVVYHDDLYWMYYHSNNKIGLATSSDGITWAKYAGNPVLDIES